MAERCMVCKESLPLLHTLDIQTVGAKSHSSLVSASRVRQDNLHLDLEEADKPHRVHRCCFKDYCQKLSHESLKRKAETLTTSDEESRAIRRSKSRHFDIKQDCLYLMT